MGVTKTDLYNPRQIELAQIAKAIGHPARVAILEQLMDRQTCICGDMVDEIGLSQPTISQHLQELKKSGLIQGSIEGRSICYCIDPVNWRKAAQVLEHFFDIERKKQPKTVLQRIMALLTEK